MYIGAVNPVAVPVPRLFCHKLPQSFRVHAVNPQVDGLSIHVLAVGNAALVGVPLLAAQAGESLPPRGA